MGYANKNYRKSASRDNNFSTMSYNNGNGYGNQTRTNKAIVKHSGCTTGLSRNEDKTPYTQGWMVRKGAMYNFLATPTKHSNKVESKTGNKYLSGIVIKVSVTRGRGLQTQLTNKNHKSGLFWGIMDTRTGQVVCEDLRLVMNPKGGKGGYCGPYGGK